MAFSLKFIPFFIVASSTFTTLVYGLQNPGGKSPLPYQRRNLTSYIECIRRFGLSVFRRKDYMCCGGEMIFRYVPIMNCCGKEGYNPTKQICCGNRVINKADQNLACCNGKEYDREKDICCGRNVHSKESHGCCRTTPYSLDTDFCCGGLVISASLGGLELGCCNGRIFNKAKHACCDTTLVTKVPETVGKEYCCGKNLYNPKDEICCAKNLYDKKRPDVDRCCYGLQYSSKSEVCCGYTPTKRLYANSGCCQRDPYTFASYDKDTGMCCDGTVTKKPRGVRMACCHGKSYDVKRAICCGNKIIRRLTGHWQCCNSTPYNGDKQLCCNGQLKPRPSVHFLCCYGSVYDNRYEECGYGHVVARGSGLG